MKKSVSLLLTVVVLVTMLTVFALPASAADAPTVIEPSQIGGIGNKGGNYIITEDGEVGAFTIGGAYAQNTTLTIAEGVTVTVTNTFINQGTINVCGTLILSDTVKIKNNRGTIRIIGCCGGTIKGTVNSPGGTITTYDDHVFTDGACIRCGTYECEVTGVHNLVSGVYTICDICGKVHEAKVNTNLDAGSTLSEGSLTIIVGVAGIAVGLVGGLLLGRKKKKPAVAGGTENEE